MRAACYCPDVDARFIEKQFYSLADPAKEIHHEGRLGSRLHAVQGDRQFIFGGDPELGGISSNDRLLEILNIRHAGSAYLS